MKKIKIIIHEENGRDFVSYDAKGYRPTEILGLLDSIKSKIMESLNSTIKLEKSKK